MRFIWPERRIVASKTLFVIFSALALFVSSGLSFALEFSADRVTRSGQQMRHQRVFYRDDMWRVEHNLPGAVNVTIVRKDQNLVWHLLPATRHFKTMIFTADYALMVTAHLDGELSRDIVGIQILDGHPTTLYEVTVREPGGGTGIYYQWLATDINFSLKLAKKDGDWAVEYRHVRIGRISDILFELPRSYRPLDPR